MREFEQVYMRIVRKLWEAISESHTGNNMFFSPLSAFVIAAMLENTAAGRTRDEITDFLGYAGYMNENRFREKLTELLLELKAERETFFANADAFAVNQKYLPFIQPKFMDRFRRTFPEAELFCQGDAAQAVNEWVSTKTKGIIGSLISPNAQPDFILLNAAVFLAEWMNEYTERAVKEKEDFTNSDGEQEKVTMLFSEEDTYIHADGVSGFAKPYKGGEYEFMALLPDDPGTRIEELMKKGIAGELYDLYRNGTNMKVYVKIPEFTYSSVENLSEPLKKLGIKRIFEEGADMSPVIMRRQAHVEEIVQKVYVQVDRNGTKAVAVTYSEWEVSAALPWEEEEYREVYLDRPILFAIMHKRTGLPVFAGIVNRVF